MTVRRMLLALLLALLALAVGAVVSGHQPDPFGGCQRPGAVC